MGETKAPIEAPLTAVERDERRRERPVGWRSRMYGRCRSKRRNRLAWLFADRQGRAILRQLREINRLPREETKR